MSYISQEQPPAKDRPLKEWLSRQTIAINNALRNIFNLNKTRLLPGKVIDGMLRFFPNPIDPDIAYPGPWIVIDGVWRPMVSMYNNGQYFNGETYYPQDVVYGEGWTMSARRKTIEYPFPVATDSETKVPDGSPPWLDSNYVGIVGSGHKYSFTHGGLLGGLKVWPSEVSANYRYNVILIETTDPVTPFIRVIPLPTLFADQWNIVILTEQVVQAGDEYIIYIEAYNSTSSVIWQYLWAFSGDDNNNPPVSGFWNKNTQNNILRINKDDGDAINHNLELQVIVNTIFTITSLGNPDSYYEFRVMTPYIDSGAYYTYEVVLISSGEGGPQSGVSCQIRSEQPVFDNTVYVSDAGHWPANNPSFATVEGYLIKDGVVQPDTTSAFGLQISFTPAQVSNDWEYISYSPDIVSARAAITLIADSVSKGNINAAAVATIFQATAYDFSDQIPVAKDTPLQIMFGAGTNTIADPIYIDGLGTIICEEEGYYEIDIVVVAGRDNINLVSKIIFWPEENGIVSEATTIMTIDSSTDRLPFTFSTNYHLFPNDEVKYFIARDDSGVNDGGLYTFSPSLPGVSDVPSSWIRITKRDLEL